MGGEVRVRVRASVSSRGVLGHNIYSPICSGGIFGKFKCDFIYKITEILRSVGQT